MDRCIVPNPPGPLAALHVLISSTMPNANNLHAFANLSTAEGQAQLRPAETWHVLSVTEDPRAAGVYTAVRHEGAYRTVCNIVLQQSPVLASMGLFWAVFAGR